MAHVLETSSQWMQSLLEMIDHESNLHPVVVVALEGVGAGGGVW